MNKFIELHNLSKSFSVNKKVKVLKKINFKFRLGKIYSLMGPSGSGKSTLLNLVSLIDRPSSGLIKYFGNQIDYKKNKLNDLFRANNIGIIYQQDNLLNDFTALENVYLASLAAGSKKVEAINKAKQILKSVGLLKRLDHYPSELSGGKTKSFNC